MKTKLALFSALCLAACAAPAPREETPSAPAVSIDIGVMWVEHSAEYQAIAAQVYAQARRDLPRFVEDATWTALPGPQDVEGKPPAIIMDVDETVVSNARYQKTLAVEPYTAFGHFRWMRDNKAVPVRGATETVLAARAAGVEVFIVTNRECEAYPGIDGDCPYEAVTLEDLREVGIEVDAEHLLMANEQPDWTKEKLHRREHIAKTHRVIMLFGDDYGDFVH